MYYVLSDGNAKAQHPNLVKIVTIMNKVFFWYFKIKIE